MAYEDLIKSIESAADEKSQEVIRNAEREVEAILREADTESTAIHAQYLEKAKRDLALESNRQKFLAKQEVKRKISAVRQQLLDKAFEKSLHSISGIRFDPSYPSLYGQLMREVFDALSGEHIVLHIDPSDSVLCEKTITTNGFQCEVMKDITTIGGLCGTSLDGKIRADNTLESRLIRIQDQNTLEIITLILGGPDG
jgi:vacuolar-type H+-ATPase subunit E/Vma4